MTACERELLEMIRRDPNPEEALLIAATVIISALKQHGSSKEQDPVYPSVPF